MGQLGIKIYIIGIGMGTCQSLTVEATQRIEESDLIIGAERMLELSNVKNKVKMQSYDPKEIGIYLRSHTKYQKPCILVSGDVGFFSGAKKIMQELSDFDIELLPGISSLLYFSAKLKIPWENIKQISMHGKKNNLIAPILENHYTFAILSGESDIWDLCKKIERYQIKNLLFHIGENLSYSTERILHIKPEECQFVQLKELMVILIENKNPRKEAWMEISDDSFVRDSKVPMTKSEVRTVSIGKLKLSQDSVLYDIGAGTGSVSIQAAVHYPNSSIYAIEKGKQALELLQKNIERFATDNVRIVPGIAPEALNALPVPTHVFIGGSTGNMAQILEHVWKKNPEVRIVVNAIALETITEVFAIMQQKKIEVEELLQVAVTKAKNIGSYHLMMGQNPVTVIVIQQFSNRGSIKEKEE